MNKSAFVFPYGIMEIKVKNVLLKEEKNAISYSQVIDKQQTNTYHIRFHEIIRV